MGNAYKAPYEVNTKGLELAMQGMQQAFQNATSNQGKMVDLTSQFVPQGAQQTTTSASFVDIAGHTYTYTTGAVAERLFIAIKTLAKISAATSAVRLGISINAVDQGSGECYSSNIDWISLDTFATIDALPNTTYTIKLRVKVAVATTTTATVANDQLVYQKALLWSVPNGMLLNPQAMPFTKYVDANGWTVYDYGFWKEYAKQVSFSQAFTAGTAVALALSSNNLPAGMATLGTNILTHSFLSSGFGGDLKVNAEMTSASVQLGFVGKGDVTRTQGGLINIRIKT